MRKKFNYSKKKVSTKKLGSNTKILPRVRSQPTTARTNIFLNMDLLRPSENVCNENDFKEIAFESIFTAFVVLALGITVAILSFIIERIKKKHPTINLKMSSKQEIGKFDDD